jgi:membrane protease YdiL (CAAX protease family)
MVGIAALHWLFVDLFKWSAMAGTTLAIFATAAAFTLYHDPASLPATGTIFVAAAGLYLGVLFVMRGFAVAVIAHAGYDAVVLLGQLTN